MPLVSVIIPVYNVAPYLSRCLDSVVGQTLKDIEIICIDDGSTDGSSEILSEYGAHDPRIKVVALERNRGVSVARNAGLDVATGEYLGFVDSDDAVDLDFYEKLYAQASATGADVVKGNRREVYDGRTIESPLNGLIRTHKTRFAFAWEFTTAIYRTSIVKDNGLHYLVGCSHSSDVAFLNEVMLHTKSLSLVDDVSYYYYRREFSVNAFVLTPEKIRSGVNVREQIVANVLSAGDVVDVAGKRFVCFWCFKTLLTLAYRAKEQADVRFCIDKAFALYEKSAPWLLETDMMSLPVVLPYFKAGDREGLYALMRKNDTEQKLICANLRYAQQLKRQSLKGV